jgi:AraC-like DNA-binding protein
MNRAEYVKTDFFHCDHTMSDESFHYTHAHERYEILYVMEGEMLRYIDGREYKLSPRSLLLIPANMPHAWKIHRQHLCHRIAMHFTPEFFHDDERVLIPSVFNPDHLCYTDDAGGNLDMFARSLLDCREFDGNMKHLALRGRMVSLLTELFHRNQKTAPRVFGNKWIEEIVEYLADNLTKPLSLETLSRHFSISKNYLNILFKKETGTTVNHYIREQRLYLARREMEEGMRAEEAAFASGFNDYSTFFRAYKDLFGVSPTATLQNTGSN